jgi:hypothetical protein
MSQEIHQIRERQKRIGEEIAELQKEHDELDVALRVLERFFKSPSKPSDKPPKAIPTGLIQRPSGIPSTFEMVETILKEAEKAGKDSLTSRELMDEIRAKYWPGVQNKQILPSIFGFSPRRLIREGDKWRRKPKPFPPQSALDDLMK